MRFCKTNVNKIDTNRFKYYHALVYVKQNGSMCDCLGLFGSRYDVALNLYFITYFWMLM